MNTWNRIGEQISSVTAQLQDVLRGIELLEAKKRPPEGMSELYDGQRRGLEAGLAALKIVQQAAQADGLHLPSTPTPYPPPLQDSPLPPTAQERVVLLGQQLTAARLELIAQQLAAGGERPGHLTARYELHGTYRWPVVQRVWPFAQAPADPDGAEAEALSERTVALLGNHGGGALDALLMDAYDPDGDESEETWALPAVN